jgi:hypothetical protein
MSAKCLSNTSSPVLKGGPPLIPFDAFGHFAPQLSDFFISQLSAKSVDFRASSSASSAYGDILLNLATGGTGCHSGR